LATLGQRDHLDAFDSAAATVATGIHGMHVDQPSLTQEGEVAFHAWVPVVVHRLGKVARPDYTESSDFSKNFAFFFA
jgi:hypothetical protein